MTICVREPPDTEVDNCTCFTDGQTEAQGDCSSGGKVLPQGVQLSASALGWGPGTLTLDNPSHPSLSLFYSYFPRDRGHLKPGIECLYFGIT